MNKKGLVLKTLLVIVFTLIVFVPMILFVSKACTRLSGQAEDSFEELAEKISSLKEGEGADSIVLKMDEESAIVGFNKDKDTVFCEKVAAKSPCYTFPYPSACEKESCICLIKKMETKPRYVKLEPYLDINYQEILCEKTELVFSPYEEKVMVRLKVPTEAEGGYSVSQEERDYEKRIFSEGGALVLGRADFLTDYSLNFEVRRGQVFFEKKEGKVKICSKKPCFS